MKSITTGATVVALILLDFPLASAKEAPAELEDYVKRSRAICVCKVKKDNGDGSVTANVVSSLKGKQEASVVIRGETGFCAVHGPVSRIMKPGQTYLVFLFKNNQVGRLGGILAIENGRTVVIRYIHGFAATEYDNDRQVQTLPLKKTYSQIRHLLNKEDIR